VGLGGQRLGGGFGQAEIDDPRHRLPVHFAYQNVRGLQIAMDDSFLIIGFGVEQFSLVASVHDQSSVDIDCLTGEGITPVAGEK
jgi:hypothetical protein